MKKERGERQEGREVKTEFRSLEERRLKGGKRLKTSGKRDV
jgi:hypothetical protein